MTPLPLNLLLILAAGAVAIVYGTNVPVRELLAVAFMGAAVAVMIRAAPPKGVPPAASIDERGNERVLTIGAYAGALAVGAFALLIAVVWPTWALALLGVAAVWVIVWWPRTLRTYTLTSHIVIERDAAAVFSFVSDLENEPRYWPMVERIEKLTTGPIGPGTRFSARVRLPASLGIRETVFEGVEEIVDYEPNHRFTTRVASGLHYNFDVVTFEEVPNGTLVTHRFEFLHSYSTAVMGATVIFGGSSNRIMKTNRIAAWARAKQILEGTG